MNVTYGYPSQFKSLRWSEWQRMALFWPEYIRIDSFHNSAQMKMVETVLKYLQTTSNTNPSIIDLGCGTGFFLKMLRSKKSSRWERLVGLDFCPNMLKLALENDVSEVPRLRLFEVDLESPLENNAVTLLHNFDIVTAIFLLDEIEDIDTCLASAASMIRPGGYLICGTLDYEREMQRYSKQIKSVKNQSTPLVLSRTLSKHRSCGEIFRVLRDTKELDRFAKSHGFRLIESEVLSSSDLHSRSDGPSLRLLIWRMDKK